MATISESPTESPKSSGDVGPNRGDLISSSRFLQRLTKMTIIDYALTQASRSYSRVKEATPSMVRPAVNSAELRALQVANHMMSFIQFLPLPLQLADELACAGLDKLEHMALYKEGILDQIYQLTPDRFQSAPLTDEEKYFYFDLIQFISSTKTIIASGLRDKLTIFIETELALVEGIEGVLKNLYSTHIGMRLDASLEGDFAAQIQNLKQLFEHAIHEQKEIVTWALGETVDRNPLAQIWKHLQNATYKLVPSEYTIKSLQDKVTLFKNILEGAVEHIKMAAEDPQQLFTEVKATIRGNVISMVRTFIPHFAITGIQRLTGVSLEVLPSKDFPFLEERSSEISSNKSGETAFGVQDTLHKSSTRKRSSVEKKTVTIAETVEIIGSDVEKSWSGDVKEVSDDAQNSYEDAEAENHNCSSGPPNEMEIRSETIKVEDKETEQSEDVNDESVHMDSENHIEPDIRKRNRNHRKRNRKITENSSYSTTKYDPHHQPPE